MGQLYFTINLPSKVKECNLPDMQDLSSHGDDDEVLNLLHHTYFFQEVAFILQICAEFALSSHNYLANPVVHHNINCLFLHKKKCLQLLLVLFVFVTGKTWYVTATQLVCRSCISSLHYFGHMMVPLVTYIDILVGISSTVQ